MRTSEIFDGIGRLIRNIEEFGWDGYKLWKNKFSKKNEIVSYKFKGLKHPLFLRSNTSDILAFSQVFVDKQYEYPIEFTPKVIIDGGANIGLTSVYYANKYPAATIIAVEPELSNFQMLKKNTAAYPQVHCLQKGIWDKQTNLEIVDSGDGNWGFTTKEVTYTNSDTIEAISIIDIVDQYKIGELGIVKIDVEGAEKKIFSNSAESWLRKTKLIIIELHDRFEKHTAKTFFAAMDAFDYKMEIKGENIFCELQ